MTKIITYTDKKGGFSRRADGAEDVAEKKKSKMLFTDEERIYAEQELDALLNDGWQILSSSTYTTDSSVMGSTIVLLTKLTVILHKPAE